jgi:hypothetical protein
MDSAQAASFVAGLETLSVADVLYDYERDGQTELTLAKGGMHRVSSACTTS